MAQNSSDVPVKAKRFPPGVYTPCISVFKPTETQEPDFDAAYATYVYQIKAGIAGLVIQGTNGEAVLISPEERMDFIRTANKAATDLGLTDYPIVAGISDQSTNGTIRLAQQAASAGANFALLLPPSYWASAVTNDVLVDYYTEVADKCPIPIVIYNFPGVTAGIDLSSDLLSELARHPNILGVKLTCANAGKVTHLTELYSPEQFSVYAGQADWLIPCCVGGGVGCVTGMGNIFPKTVSRLYKLWTDGKLDEAKALQGAVSKAEKACREGLALTKFGVGHYVGPRIGFTDPATYYPRKPYKPMAKAREAWCLEKLKHLDDIERTLPDVVGPNAAKA